MIVLHYVSNVNTPYLPGIDVVPCVMPGSFPLGTPSREYEEEVPVILTTQR